MNPPEKKLYKLGPAIRNICEELENELNEIVCDMANNKGEKTGKIRESKDKIKHNFYALLKQTMKTLKNIIEIDEVETNRRFLNDFYQVIGRIIDNLTFLNIMCDVYIFPEFNINDTIDLIFEGSTNNLRNKLIDSQLLDSIISKNLYDSNDFQFLINNDLNNIDFNKEEKGMINKNSINVLFDKNELISKNITKRIISKFEEFNKFIISTKECYNENNFKLYMDKFICLRLYNNFEIKFTIGQLKRNNYFILPIEIGYNKQKINLNDKDANYIDKNKILTKNDLYFYINKFKIIKRNFSINEELKITSLNKEDFLEKCLLFHQYTIELFNEKFDNLIKEIKKKIDKYDFPIQLEDKNDTQMDIENKNDKLKEENNQNIKEISIFYDFSISMKKKNEFYIKLIYNSELPTNIKIIYSHYLIKNNNQNNIKSSSYIIVEEKEMLINFDLKMIEREIINYFEIYKRILLNWIRKKIKYIYPIYFNTLFVKDNSNAILYGMKNNDEFIKYFSIIINEKGKLYYENLYSSQLFNDGFKEINSIITNYLKCDEEDEKINDYIIQFNDYIKFIIIEKIFIFSQDKIKLIDLDNKTKIMRLHIYNSYNTDININTYFDIKCQLYDRNKNIINSFKIEDIKLICNNIKDNNKKIIFDCDCRNYQSMIEISSQFQKFFRKLANELNQKYEVFSNIIYDIIKLSEGKKTCFEFKHPLNLKENLLIGSKEENQWIELSNENNNFDLFNQEYKKKLMIYFKSIKISKENNIFKFYLKENIFKNRNNYKNIPNFFFENYTTMIQNIILSYDYNEDAISITALGKMKLGYSNKIQIIFEEIIEKIIYYMNTIFKLIDYLLINDTVPEIRVCPLFMTLTIECEKNFKHILNFKFTLDKASFFVVEGNFNSLFNLFFVKHFGEELVLKEYNFNNREYYRIKSEYFYINYQVYDLFINKYKFKISMIEYPFNHFVTENINIYCLIKDFNVINLMSLNNMILSLQIRNDNNLYLEFRDKFNAEFDNNKFNLFIQNLKDSNYNYNCNFEQKIGYNKIIILINDENINEKFKKFNEIIKIFISLSKL